MLKDIQAYRLSAPPAGPVLRLYLDLYPVSVGLDRITASLLGWRHATPVDLRYVIVPLFLFRFCAW